MTISLNQFAPNVALDGQYSYMANERQLHNVIIGGDDPVTPGTFVALDSSSSNTNAPVVVAAASTDKIFGLVVFDPIVNLFAPGERVAIARENDIVFKTASGAVNVGDDLFIDSNNKVTASGSAGDTKIGIALTPAAADGDLIQVELKFVSAIVATQLPDLSDTYIAVTEKGVADGVATLDSTGKIPAAQIPA